MEHGDLQAFGGNHTQAGIRVAQHQHGIRAFRSKQLVALKDNVAHCLAEVLTDHAQVVMRLADTQVVEEHLVQFVVVVLTRMNDREVEVLVGLTHDLGQLDDLRACAHDDHKFQLAHIYITS